VSKILLNEDYYMGNEFDVKQVVKLDNKVFVVLLLNKLKENNLLDDSLMCKLTDSEYCKQNFKLAFEVLREIASGQDERKACFVSGHRRYYAKLKIETNSRKKCFVCNHWYEEQKELFANKVLRLLLK